jgi:hypothetical protein
VRHLTLPILSWQYCLRGLREGSLTTVVVFRVALDSMNNGTLCGVPFQHMELLGPTFSRVMTVSLWQWTLNVITTCWNLFPTWDEMSQLEYGKCTGEIAAMPWLSWRTSLRCCIEDVRLFWWIQDTDLINCVQLYLLLCTISVLSYFQNGQH